MDPLTIVGNIICVAYVIFVFLTYWISDWYFNVEKSPTLDYLYATWLWLTTK